MPTSLTPAAQVVRPVPSADPVAGQSLTPPAVRYQSLDVWRGIACLMVVILHASFYWKFDRPEPGASDGQIAVRLLELVSRMAVGVQIFFVISGYCIAATADSVRRKPGRTTEYFRRRVRRIFPPYWAALAFAILLPAVLTAAGWPGLFDATGAVNTGSVPSAGRLTASQWFGNLTLTEHFRYHLFGSPELKLLGPSWSLSYEEQFYFVCGVILLVAPRKFFGGAVAVSLCTGVVMVLNAAGFNLPVEGFFFDGRWLLFAAGIAVYYHRNYGAAVRPWLIPGTLGLAATLALVVRFGVLAASDADRRAWANEYVAGTFFAILLMALSRWDHRIATARLLRPLAACGTMCYSLYLVHYPITKVISAALFRAGVRGAWPTLLVTIPVATAASCLAAWAFFRVVERRYLNPPGQVGAAEGGGNSARAGAAAPALAVG